MIVFDYTLDVFVNPHIFIRNVDVVKPDHSACQGEFLELQCPEAQVINVHAANYGRSVSQRVLQ